ncbi:prolyl oligopeptidase family serine peptidase [Xanthomonas sp. XNM01]|uniref:S9 family peptidase n=1 Tax=Xanthomonas sp. XNM01 TaxID=2769289 RepID=UPI00178437C1|nr:prolyl oligopeptidase family serine peptidase [Xanthomonas sp. XNM01]MBD9367208.1 S9 family peptidase [Xanthomonas sp. XNM01]
MRPVSVHLPRLSVARLAAGVLIAACAFHAGASTPAATAPAAADAGYRMPVDALKAIVDAPRAPTLSLGPKRDIAAMVRTPDLPGIDVVAQPELKLGGLRIHPRVYAESRFSFGSDLWLMDIATGAETRIAGLPQHLAIAGIAWSPDQRHLAFNHIDGASGGNELWLVDIAARTARRLVAGLNTVNGGGYAWLPDSRGLLVQLRPARPLPLPAADAVPTGPAIQETEAGAGVRSVRTYQDLLRNETDARTLEHYLTVQPARVDLQGRTTLLGAPGLFTSLSVAPGGAHILAQRVERPFSYLVPVFRFPRVIEVLDAAGKPQHTVARLPLVDGLPTGNDAVATGVRAVSWRADAPATLVWAEAQDGGDPAREAQVRDAVFLQAAPFTAAPVRVADLEYRYAGITWGRGDLALLDEMWRKTRRTKSWRIQPDHPAQAPQLLHDRSSEDRYADPGEPVTVADASGRQRLLTGADGNSLYLIGDGASPEGDRPFLDRYDLASGTTSRLFHSHERRYEVPRALLDDGATRLLITSESPTEPTNYRVVTFGSVIDDHTVLTRFPHPLPQLREVRKELIRYSRADGVELSATLYLPPGYDPQRDGPRPTLLWAYPREFKSADAASQVIGSPHRFNAISYWGPLPYLARGFVVLDGPTMPIVGEGDAEPNDTYVEQLVASAQAAVDEVVRRGVTDPEKVAIGGHSYGAFMTANLLAHSRIFKAGIARSGAYNRTLTPFGFQAEERNYWQAQQTYLTMSPFNYAQNIKDPILLIHGEQDNNSGTFPMQSERLFGAIKGLGGTARLVMLPNESHGYRARESILHMLAETDDWLQTHVVGAQGQPAAR